MPKQPKERARLLLIRLVFGGGVVGFVTLGGVSRYYNLASENVVEGAKVLLGIYLPLIAVMASFYQDQLSQLRNDPRPVPGTMLTFASYSVIAWVLTPPLLLLAMSTIEDALGILKWLQGTAGALVAGAVGLFFAKTSPDASG